MSWRSIVLALVGAMSVAAAACARDPALATRYAMEKALYDARQLELGAYSKYPSDDYDAWRSAVGAYQAVVAFEGSLPDSALHGRVVRDCRGVILRARIGLVRLAYLDYREHDAVTHPGAGEPDIPPWMDVPWRTPLVHAQSLYDSLGEDPTYRVCAVLMRQITSDALLWESPDLMRDSLMVIPSALAECALDREGVAGAERFYSRVVSEWPDSALSSVARVYRARVFALDSRFDSAAADLDSALVRIDDIPDAKRAGAYLLRGQILSFGLRREGEGRDALVETAERFPAALEGGTARLCIAMMDRARGATSDAFVASLRELERDNGVAGEVAGRAMLLHAIALEETGKWEDGSSMLWQVCSMFPYTRPALAAPLRIIRHHLDAKEPDDARRACDKATALYLELISRNSAMVRPRNLPKDFFVEASLLTDDGERAAARLGTPPATWAADNAVASRYKSALLYNTILRDREKGVGILQKSLALFSRSRYLRATRRELDRDAPARGADTVTDPSDSSR